MLEVTTTAVRTEYKREFHTGWRDYVPHDRLVACDEAAMQQFLLNSLGQVARIAMTISFIV